MKPFAITRIITVAIHDSSILINQLLLLLFTILKHEKVLCNITNGTHAELNLFMSLSRMNLLRKLSDTLKEVESSCCPSRVKCKQCFKNLPSLSGLAGTFQVLSRCFITFSVSKGTLTDHLDNIHLNITHDNIVHWPQGLKARMEFI